MPTEVDNMNILLHAVSAIDNAEIQSHQRTFFASGIRHNKFL
jgi:hypothetical protein